jgi:hypothetical protein
VHFFFDESGDFDLGGPASKPSVIAAVVVPDSLLGCVSEWTERKQVVWAMPELQGTKMSSAQLGEVCEFFATTNLCGCAVLTDGRLVPPDEFRDYRIRQAARTASDYSRSEAAARGDATTAELSNRLIKAAGLASALNDPEFAEFAMLMPRQIFDALQASLLVYRDPSWRSDFEELHWVFDGKHAADRRPKLSSGERRLSEMLMMIVGGDRRFVLRIPDEIGPDPTHPYFARHHREGEPLEVGVRALFRNGLRFESSAAFAGLQLADVVAHLLRRAAMEPANRTIQAAFNRLRPGLMPHYPPNQIPFRFFSTLSVDVDELHRYAHLF